MGVWDSLEMLDGSWCFKFFSDKPNALVRFRWVLTNTSCDKVEYSQTRQEPGVRNLMNLNDMLLGLHVFVIYTSFVAKNWSDPISTWAPRFAENHTELQFYHIPSQQSKHDTRPSGWTPGDLSLIHTAGWTAWKISSTCFSIARPKRGCTVFPRYLQMI